MTKIWTREHRVVKIALLLFSTVFIGNKILYAQDKLPVKFGSVSLTDFDLPKSSAIDSNANAVIIADVGSTEFIGNKNNWISYEFKNTTRVKILNKKGYDIATVKIRLRGESDRQDQISDFSATTYNIENGNVIKTSLDKNELFNEKISKSVTVKSFTMPNLKEGSIIEYSYTITSFRFQNIPGWSFQNINYPCLYSEYKIGIPNLVRYVTIHNGLDSFYSYKSDEGYKSLHMGTLNVGSPIHNHTWVMKNIMPFKHEDFIDQPRNYVDEIHFALTQTYNGETISDVMTTWKTAEDELLSYRNFGVAIDIENSTNLYNTMKKICQLDGDIIIAAKSIYNYVKDNFTCTPNDDIYLTNDLYEVNKSLKGNVSDLNMLLIGLLRQRGIKADPVLLSTKEYGAHSENYPIIQQMNYVICMVRIGNDTIYLDASDPLISFGKLPLSCYNGHAEIIDQKHSGSVYFNSNLIKEQNMVSVIIVNDEKGNGSSGGYQSSLGYFGSYDVRNLIKEKGEKEYLKNIQLNYGSDIDITNFKIDSLKQLEEPITINYDFNYKQGNVDDIIYFNPVIASVYKENPFKSAERKYPIEMPYPIDDLYILNMEIPKGYMVDELPKSAKVAFNGNDGYFEYNIQKEENSVQLRSHVKLKQAVFAAADYNSLRGFFSFIVKKQSEQIVFKKK